MERERTIATAIALALFASPVHAQERSTAPSSAPQPVVSMGQPSRWQHYTAGLGLADRASGDVAGNLLVGVYHPVMNPVTGLFGGTAEAYGTVGGAFAGGGGRLLASAPAFALGAGYDWNVAKKRVDFVLSFKTAVRRGGLLGHGTMLRLDWLPTRGRTLGLGIQAPLSQPFAGRTRPRHTDVDLPRASDRAPVETSSVSSATEAELARVERAASLIADYNNLYSEENARNLLAGDSYDSAMRTYQNALARAFAITAGDSVAGERLATHARAGLLNEVLLPYDSLYGQVKETDDIGGLTSPAHASFERWVRDSSRVAAVAQPAVVHAHARWLGIVEGIHRQLLAQWKDSRAIWLPLQLALAPEQYDEQTEVDSLLARAIGRPFTDRNAFTLLRSTDLPIEIARSIYAARDYHVLWTHDFAGRVLETGAVDNVSYEMVADAYLPALTEAVKRYDSTGHLPVFMILLDQFFYEPNDGRLWMDMLEDPLGASMSLPGDNATREAHLRQRQADLRAAVAASARLQAEARHSGGEKWLRRLVKVHVSIPHPADFSFRSHKTIPWIPLTPDNIIRDHRKIVFYDVNEAEPYRGAMFLMGVGIGEHYANASWEDRGYRVRGPAALEARVSLRRLLRQNGFSETDIPGPLREMAKAKVVERQMNLNDYIGRALQVHNDVGFATKQSSVARAMLYNLAQPGSVIIVPDPLWLSAEWAAMLTGAAARGVRAYVIAPALANAPSPEAPVMALAHDVMLRLLQLRERLDAPIRRAGGDLRVGLFAAKAQVDDPAGIQREVRDGIQRAPWISDVIPFDSRTLAVLSRAEARTTTDGKGATALAPDVPPRPPQLHQKTQLVARPGAISALVRQPGWETALASAMQVQSQQTVRFAEQLGWSTPDAETEAMHGADVLLRGYEQSIPEAERKKVSFYFTLGTQNQDPRGMMLDGEASLLVSGFYAAGGLVDLYYVMARSTWITTQAQLDALLPPPSGLMRRVVRLIRPAL